MTVASTSRSRLLAIGLPVLVGLSAGTAGAVAVSWRQVPMAAVAVGPAEKRPDAEPAVRTGPMAREVMLALVRSTLAAVQHANETGNYQVLHDLGAPGFRDANPTGRLAEIFRSQREGGLDLSGVMFTEPSLKAPPSLEPNGMMRVAGHFPAGRAKLDFDLVYQPVEGRWRLFGISTGVSRAEPRLAQAGGRP